MSEKMFDLVEKMNLDLEEIKNDEIKKNFEEKIDSKEMKNEKNKNNIENKNIIINIENKDKSKINGDMKLKI